MSNKKEIKRKIHKLISNNYNGEAQINIYNINKKLNIAEKQNQNNDDIISKKISNAFDVLEQLILDDNINEKKEEKLKISSSSDEEEKTNDVNILKSKKLAKTILIPKLDFSDIFEDYINNPLIIKEINNCTKLENHKGNTHNTHIYQKSKY